MRSFICLFALALVPSLASAQATMKAAVAKEFGGPEVLKLDTLPRPEPKDDDVLIRVIAAGVNPVDGYIRAGKFPGGKTPLIPGMDIAGVVEQTGTKATKFKKGDAVYAYLSFSEQGGYAEYALAKENEVALKPAKMSFEEAAAIPLAATTAWQALIDTAKLSSGQTVLIQGGSGGVGGFAIQIAKAKGAKVIATASGPNQELLKQFGADQVIDYSKTKFEDVVKDVDVVLDCVGKDTIARSYGVIKKGGYLVCIAGAPDEAELAKHGVKGSSMRAHPDAAVLEELTKLADAGKFKAVVSDALPLADAAKAHEQIATRHTRGKIVLKVAESPN